MVLFLYYFPDPVLRLKHPYRKIIPTCDVHISGVKKNNSENTHPRNVRSSNLVRNFSSDNHTNPAFEIDFSLPKKNTREPGWYYFLYYFPDIISFLCVQYTKTILSDKKEMEITEGREICSSCKKTYKNERTLSHHQKNDCHMLYKKRKVNSVTDTIPEKEGQDMHIQICHSWRVLLKDSKNKKT